MEASAYNLKTTIVIVTFLSDEIIERCLENLGKKNNIIVVENSNREKFKENIEKKFENVKCHLMGYDAGFPKAANFGIKLANTKFIFLINPDTFPEKECAKKLEFFANDQNNSPIIFPLTIRENNKVSYNFGFFDSKKKEDISKKFFKVDYSNGNAIFLNKDFFYGNNVFDENIFLQFDETDLCWRLKKDKKDVFLLTDAKVKHLEGKSHKQEFDFELKKEVWWHNGWSHIYLAKKHFKKIDLIILVIKKLSTSISKSLLCLMLLRNNHSLFYFLNAYGIFCSLFNFKSFYRSKINQNLKN